ncbi:DCC1-like thiol-disulfide oxidoreductase family protein [Streptomyces longwoodensis]|uniref:thiol-disulfide oxidoreductase DCC family protein n=1 Tax=Streptomyces longwoodensis TaxID=68231 RepID=UPI0033FF3146
MIPVPAEADRVPVRGLTVLYDADCPPCAFLRDWLVRQPQLVPLDLVPAGSEQARRLLPGLDHAATLDEITVVDDAGQVYRDAAAWVVTLWALRRHRALAHRLSTPSGLRLARGAALAAAKWRGAHRGRAPAWPTPYGPPQAQDRPWGGQGYRRADGWVYDPAAGWTYRPGGDGCAGGTCATR